MDGNTSSQVGFWKPFLLVVLTGILVVLSYREVYSPYVEAQSMQEEASASNIPQTPENNTIGVTSTPEPPSVDTNGQESTPETTALSTTDTSVQEVGEQYSLPIPTGDTIGDSGLKPSTAIAVVTSRTSQSINYENCTVAFSLKGKSGFPWAITAGHCGNVGDKVYYLPENGDWNQSYFLGTVRYVSHPDYDSGAGDWGAIRLYGKAPLPKSLGEVPAMLDTTRPDLGQSLCKHGNRTGFTCGVQGEKDIRAILKKEQGEEITGKLDEVQKICALPGDSGSPVFTEDTIIGVLSSTDASESTSSKDTCSGVLSAYYVPIGEVLQQIEENVPDAVIPEKK